MLQRRQGAERVEAGQGSDLRGGQDRRELLRARSRAADQLARQHGEDAGGHQRQLVLLWRLGGTMGDVGRVEADGEDATDRTAGGGSGRHWLAPRRRVGRPLDRGGRPPGVMTPPGGACQLTPYRDDPTPLGDPSGRDPPYPHFG